MLHPDVVLRSDGGTGRPAASLFFRGAQEVAGNAVMYGALAPHARPVLVNGTPGVLVVPRKEAVSVMAFTVNDGLIVAIDVLADPVRLRALGVASLAG